MKKLNYKTRYFKDFFRALKDYSVTFDLYPDQLTAHAESPKGIQEVIEIFKTLKMPLTYQIEGGGKTLTIFNPTL